MKGRAGLCALALASMALAGCHQPGTASGSSSNAWGGNPLAAASSSGATSSTGATATNTTRQADLSWTAPTTNTDGSPLTDLAGFIVLYGTSANSLTQSVKLSAGTTDYVVQNLSSGTWYFAIESYTTSGAVSSLSSVVSKTIT